MEKNLKNSPAFCIKGVAKPFQAMNRLSFALACVLFGFCSRWVSAADSAPPTSIFPDKKLEAAVRKYVFEKRDNDKPLVEADVVNISTVDAKGQGITDLTGLEKCQNLASFDAAKNQIRNVAALKGMTKLQYLNLAENQLEDISPLAAIPALQYIELSHNRVADLAPLQSLTNLAALYLSDNRITDMTPILGLPRLTSLYLDGNLVRSIAGINKLKSLATLSLKDNAIRDLAPLQGLEGLSWLFLDENKIHDIAPLVEMIKQDKEHKFAPFIKIYLGGNPLNPGSQEQIAALKESGTRIHP